MKETVRMQNRESAKTDTAGTLLLVDDNESIRESLSWLLRMSNFHVLQAQNPTEALELMERERPRVVVTDLMMPEMHGADFIRVVRSASSPIATTPIIALSVHGPRELDLAREAGADACVDKLADFDELLAAVRGVISNEQ
jgi:DNA-binding response OmpR family regulator